MSNKSASRKTFRPWIVWGIATLYFFYDYVQQVAPGAMVKDLSTHFNVGAASMGFIASVYFYSYALMQIPIGMMADRFGPHRPLAAAALISCTAGALFTFTSTPAEAIGVRIILGAATGFSFVSCLKLVDNWFPPEKFATMVGLTNIIGMSGAVMGEAPLTESVTRFGWENTLLGIAAFGGLIFLLIIFKIKDRPENTKHQPDSLEKPPATIPVLIQIFKTPSAWLNAGYAATINMVYTGFGALWGTVFISKLYGISTTDAAFMVSMIFVGAIPGSFFFGWFSDRIGKRGIPMIIASAGGLICMASVVYVPHIPYTLMFGLMLLLGFCCSGNVVAYAFGNDISPKGADGISLGFVNTFLIGGSAIAQPLIGWLLEHGSSSIKDLSIIEFRYSLTVLVIAKTFALCSALVIHKLRPDE
ncbi:MFS transporter [Maridesulfovibrio sp.]|uniref:MFS transporter n=1 Tax=Maridesulfovibrio sp. TaxID=2795000 RepID=UPI003BACF2AC